VALEIQWRDAFSVVFGKLARGDSIRTRFGVFFELRGGRNFPRTTATAASPFEAIWNAVAATPRPGAFDNSRTDGGLGAFVCRLG
jgi:hypothetical protein